MREIAVIAIVIVLAHVGAAVIARLPGSIREFEANDWHQRLDDMREHGVSQVR